ncbi:hypothetical protein ETAA8_06620 [Anatilimnocola aggregata]|uniref:Uncharacterized protein n=1 Tax=Anatilimnocola aggregata TaxID=2528021 RepID=A0A517Y640_9BACT|nr:hypothetical protein [Anatilimnocola aggregata]QDU25592.1 hypothetical protein ETAA8_06620 [Anatilimnocola aggregata]
MTWFASIALWYAKFVTRRSIDNYYFWDGIEIRRVDVLPISRAAASERGLSDDVLARMNSGSTDAAGAMAAAVRHVFRVPPHSRGGLSERQLIELFIDFAGQLDRAMKTTPFFKE